MISGKNKKCEKSDKCDGNKKSWAKQATNGGGGCHSQHENGERDRKLLPNVRVDLERSKQDENSRNRDQIVNEIIDVVATPVPFVMWVRSSGCE